MIKNFLFFEEALIYFFLIAGFVIYMTVPAYAAEQASDLPSIKVPPESFYYSFKRIIEKVQVNFYINSDGKADFYKDLIQERLAELKYVVNRSYLDQLEKSSQRVSYQVGTLTDYITGKNINNKKSTTVDLFKKDKIILEGLRDKYPANSSFWMLIQHVINSIDLNLQKL